MENSKLEAMQKTGTVFEARPTLDGHYYRAWWDDFNGWQFLTLDSEDMPTAKETFAPDDKDGGLKLWSEMTEVASPGHWQPVTPDEESGDGAAYVTGEDVGDGLDLPFEDEDDDSDDY
jgi:hypothetical protein